MGEALQQRNLPPSLDISVEEEKPNPPSTDVHKPILTPSPRCNGSTLYYDSFELRAVTNHLNKAMQSLNTSSPTLISFLKSPFYSHYLDSIHKRNAKTPKMIMGSQFTRRSLDCKASRAGTTAARGGFIRRLWKKVKQGVLRNKQGNEG